MADGATRRERAIKQDGGTLVPTKVNPFGGPTEIELPFPELLTSRVDHSRTQTWQVRKTAWMPWSGDGDKLRDQVMREAQKLVAQAAASGEYIAQSKTAAEAIIAAFFAELGWSVEVRWADADGGTVAKTR